MILECSFPLTAVHGRYLHGGGYVKARKRYALRFPMKMKVSVDKQNLKGDIKVISH